MILLQYFSNTIARLLLPVDGAHAASCEEMGTAVSKVEAAAYKGLLQCIDTVMAEVRISSFFLIPNSLMVDLTNIIVLYLFIWAWEQSWQ